MLISIYCLQNEAKRLRQTSNLQGITSFGDISALTGASSSPMVSLTSIK